MNEPFKMGDLVLIKGEKKDHLIRIDGAMFRLSEPRGAFDTNRIVGLREGDELKVGKVLFRVVRPDILDSIVNLKRGAQVIIPKDSSRIVMELGLGNGCRIVEGGVGSGALTMALLNSVHPAGRVISYDIRKDHLENAGSNIVNTEVAGCWEGKIGSIYEKIDENNLDGMVVDVPEPERAVRTAMDSLRKGGRFCSYIPTVNQMERIFLELKKNGFSDIRGIEIIERGYSIKEGATRPQTEILNHTGFLVFARWLGSFEP